MKSEFLIVIFKNKLRYKIIKKYRQYKTAIVFYEKLLKESENVFFDIQTENGRDINYELALLETKTSKSESIYITDDMGRNIKVELDDPEYNIIKISKYNFPEKLTNISTKERIDASIIVNQYLKGTNLKLISKLNNKIVIQDDDKFNLFSTKSIYDAERFIDSLEKHLINNNKRNCLIVKDTDVAQKKYLYEVLSNLGYDKKMLYRVSTTHLKHK